MTEELKRTFNDEVNRYRNTLLFYAKKCDWDTFKLNAGRLFDYIESIERSEIERRFFKISRIIVCSLALVVFSIFKADPGISPVFIRLKEIIVIMAVGGCCFEVYFFLNFRIYMKQKVYFYRKRRERFITDIERDFREITVEAGTEADFVHSNVGTQ